MTIGMLRRLIADLPDDAPYLAWREGNGPVAQTVPSTCLVTGNVSKWDYIGCYVVHSLDGRGLLPKVRDNRRALVELRGDHEDVTTAEFITNMKHYLKFIPMALAAERNKKALTDTDRELVEVELDNMRQNLERLEDQS